MTSTNLSPRLAPLAIPLERAPTPFPSSPRNSPRPSPSRLAEIERDSMRASIRLCVDKFREGSCDIDGAVAELNERAIQKKVFARETYEIFMDGVAVRADVQLLVQSRQSLYAAHIFAKYAGCEKEYDVREAEFVRQENQLMIEMPQLRQGKL